MPREIRSSPPIISQGTTPYLLMILVALGLLLFQVLGGGNPGTPTLVPLPPDTSTSSTTDSLSVYFTNPTLQGNGPDLTVVQDLDAAQHSIDMAMYNLSLDNVCQSLIQAAQRGVKVRLVTESNSMDNGCYDDLKSAGIGVLGDRREGLMHNKFIVIDAGTVWTGSLNLTGSGTYQDNNNFIRIVSSRAAKDYTNEFNEMYEQDQFGPEGSANTPYPQVTVNGIVIEIYFSPDDGVSTRLEDLLGTAQSSVDFLAYSFTLDTLADTLRARARKGVRVRGVFDQSQVESNGSASEYYTLKDAGLDVRQDGIEGLMHNKVFIIDEKIVVTGSFNFSRNADRINDENLVIIHSPELAARYLAEFEKIYSLAQ